MKVSYVVIALSLVLAFLGGRWYSGSLFAPPADCAIAGLGLLAQRPAANRGLTQPQSVRDAQVSQLPAMPKIPPSLSEPPLLPGRPQVVHNTGPFIEVDPGKLIPSTYGSDPQRRDVHRCRRSS